MVKDKRVLVSPSSFGSCGAEPLDILEGSGIEVVPNPFGRKLTEDEVIQYAEGCIGIVAGVEPLNQRVIDQLPELKCISRVGVGMESVDVAYAEAKGIVVMNTPDGPTRAVAELTLGHTLTLLRKISLSDRRMHGAIWKKEIGNLLFGKNVCVIGTGRIGKMVSNLFKAFEAKIFAYDLYPDNEWASQAGVQYLSLEELLSKADILTLHVPGSSDKKSLLGREQLNLMKDGSFIINMSRGGVVDEKALLEALGSNKIAGAALDVFETEPYDGPFSSMDNVVMTPHLGSYAVEGKLKMEIDAVKNLLVALA